MKHLALLSPILLAACVQHQDPCVTSRPPCNPLIEDCICEYSGQDSDRDGSGVGGDRVTPPSGDDGGSEGSGPSDDSNGGVSDKTSDKNEDRPSKDHSDDSNGHGSSDGSNSGDERHPARSFFAYPPEVTVPEGGAGTVLILLEATS